jgi:hypothetical protein
MFSINIIRRQALRPRSPNAWLPIAILATFIATGAAAAEPQFSAELVRRDAQGQVLEGRLSVAGDKIRIAQPNLPIGVFIVHGDAAFFVKPDRRVYMDARQSTLLTELLTPVDPDAPCPRFQAMAVISGSAADGSWRCDRIGDETIDGRATVKYSLISPHGRHLTGWIDPDLRFLVRIAADTGVSLALTDVRQGPQPDSDFEIPALYPKFDPQRLIDKMQHSDSYVDPAKDSRAEPLKPSLGPDL